MPKKRKKGQSVSTSAGQSISAAKTPIIEDAEELTPVSDDSSEIEILPAEAEFDVEVLPAETEGFNAAESDEVEPASQRSIVSYDPLEAYLREIKRYRSLNREEELELATKYYEHKDRDAAYKLVTSNLWLVVKIARDYERAARSLLDVIQEGNIGLMEAIKNFDPYRGVRFPSYAAWWIKAYILRFVIANWRMVKIGTTQAQRKLFFNLKKEKDKLEREGFIVGTKLLAEKLDVRESDIIEMEQRLSSPDVSVHAPLQADGDSDFLSVLPDSTPSAEDILSKKQSHKLLSESLEQFASTLSEKELVIFRERLLGDEKLTLHDIAERFSLSKERIRQIENRIREKLKVFLEEKLGDSVNTIEMEE